MDNGFLVFMIVLLSFMLVAGFHRRALRARLVRHMIEEEYTGTEIEKALKAYDGEEE